MNSRLSQRESAVRKSKVNKAFARGFAAIEPSVTGTASLDKAAEGRLHEQTAEAMRAAVAVLANPTEVVIHKLASTWQAAADELESVHRLKSAEVDEDIEAVRKRFNHIKKKNTRRRKRIEKVAVALRARQLLWHCFARLKAERVQAQRVVRSSGLIQLRNNRTWLSRCFSAWQRDSSAAAAVRRRQNGSELARKRLEERHKAELCQLQASIVALEKEIARVDVAHSELSFNLSQRLLQAMSTLNVEVVELRKGELEVLQKGDKTSLTLLQSELEAGLSMSLSKKAN